MVSFGFGLFGPQGQGQGHIVKFRDYILIFIPWNRTTCKSQSLKQYNLQSLHFMLYILSTTSRSLLALKTEKVLPFPCHLQ